jgi:hypothetical protein
MGLIILLKEANKTGTFKGFNIRGDYYVRHLLFVDDILIFCEGLKRVIEKLKDIIELLCMATSMKINLAKSTISLWGINEMVKNFIIQLFPYYLIDLDVG